MPFLMIQLENVSAQFADHKGGDIKALQSVSMRFEAARFYAIVGPSGSGKTTLIHIIAGILQFAGFCQENVRQNGDRVIRKLSRMTDFNSPTSSPETWLMSVRSSRTPRILRVGSPVESM